MADSNIKKYIIKQDDLPTIDSLTQKFNIRYRIISEDKNRLSHWSPIISIDPQYVYVPGNIEIVSSGITTVVWDPVTIKIGTTTIRQAKDYDVWVKWSKAAGNGDWNYVNFGIYSRCEIGDTLYFEREDGWYLILVKTSKGKKKK